MIGMVRFIEIVIIGVAFVFDELNRIVFKLKTLFNVRNEFNVAFLINKNFFSKRCSFRF